MNLGCFFEGQIVARLVNYCDESRILYVAECQSGEIGQFFGVFSVYFDQFSVYFRSIFGQFRVNLEWILGEFWMNFRSILSQFSVDFRSIFGQFSVNFQSILCHFLVNFRAILGRFLVNFMLIFGNVLVNFWSIFVRCRMPINREKSPNIQVDKAALRERLTPVEYQVTQEKMTERWVKKLSIFLNINSSRICVDSFF